MPSRQLCVALMSASILRELQEIRDPNYFGVINNCASVNQFYLAEQRALEESRVRGGWVERGSLLSLFEKLHTRSGKSCDGRDSQRVAA